MANTQAIQENIETESRHPWLKKILIIAVILYLILYVVSESGMRDVANKTKDLFLQTNAQLLNQTVSIDHIVTSMYGDGNNIFDLKLSNPQGFNSPYMLYIPEIRINSVYSADPKIPHIILPTVIIKKAIFNYEINAAKSVNFYKTLDTIINKLSPGPNFQALSILTSATNPTPISPLKYNGTKFFLGDVILENPTINVYNNNALVKQIPMQELIIRFATIKQPLQYGDALLAGSLQLIDQIDKIVKKP